MFQYVECVINAAALCVVELGRSGKKNVSLDPGPQIPMAATPGHG